LPVSTQWLGAEPATDQRQISKIEAILSFSLDAHYRFLHGPLCPREQSVMLAQFVPYVYRNQYFYRKMPTLVRTAVLAAATIALSDAASAAACRHFSIWHFPWPQPCPDKPIGQFINEPSPPAPAPASPPTPDEEAQRQQGIEKLKERLNSQKQR
jgi:hypothetical protein